MVFDVLAWVLILAVAYNAGSGVLALAGAHRLRRGDRVILATWSGVVLLSLVLLGLSLVTPLSPGAGAAAAVVLGVGGHLIGRRTGRPDAGGATQEAPISRGALALGLAMIAVGAAAVTSDPVTLYDSLVYHVGMVRWLRTHGTVPGVALIHNRLGHVSTWFALAAPFEPGRGPNTAANVPLGVALVLVASQGAIGAARVVARQANTADWVLALSSLALIWPVLIANAATPSPDVAANAMIVVTVWAMLAVTSKSIGGSPNAWLTPRLVPFVLAVGASAVKLFAAPAVLAAVAFYAIRHDKEGSLRVLWPRVGVSVLVGLVLGSPFLAANFIATGCVLFPVPWSCLDTGWAFGIAHVADYAEYIRDVAQWETRGPSAGASPLGWVAPWVGAHPIMTVLVSCAPVLAIIGVRRARSDAVPIAMVASLIGIALAAWQAPAPRFLYGYVILPPVLALSALLGRRVGWPDSGPVTAPTATASPRARQAAAVGFVAFAALASGAYAVVSQKVNVVSAVRGASSPVRARLGQLLAPVPPMVPARLFRWRVNDVDVLTPVPRPIADTLGYHSAIDGDLGFEKCSTAPLPCTPYLPSRDVRLRVPSRGIDGGFVRQLDARELSDVRPRCLGTVSSGAGFAGPTPDASDRTRGSAECGLDSTRD